MNLVVQSLEKVLHRKITNLDAQSLLIRDFGIESIDLVDFEFVLGETCGQEIALSEILRYVQDDTSGNKASAKSQSPGQRPRRDIKVADLLAAARSQHLIR